MTTAIKPTKVRDRFTTGQIAKICVVAARTVSMWVDSGRLKGFRIPSRNAGAEGDRRVPRDELIRFMQARGFPGWEALEGERASIVALVGIGQPLADALRVSLPPSLCRIESFGNVFRAGAFLAANRVSTVVIDLRIGRAAVAEVIAESPAGTAFVVVAPEESTGPEVQEFEGVRGVRLLRAPFDPAELAGMLAEAGAP